MPFQSLRPNWPFHVSLVLGGPLSLPRPPTQRLPAALTYNSLQITKKKKKKTVVMTLL